MRSISRSAEDLRPNSPRRPPAPSAPCARLLALRRPKVRQHRLLLRSRIGIICRRSRKATDGNACLGASTLPARRPRATMLCPATQQSSHSHTGLISGRALLAELVAPYRSIGTGYTSMPLEAYRTKATSKSRRSPKVASLRVKRMPYLSSFKNTQRAICITTSGWSSTACC